MDELITAITPAISTLANFFGTTVEYLQTHLMEYVLKYGEYCYAINIATAFSTCFTIGLVSWIIAACILWGVIYYESSSYKEWIRLSIKWTVISFFVIAIILFTCGLVWFLCTTYIPYKASPEIWSITKVMELIKS
ncbi:MAG: hypothetical protein NC218_11815 [Acetobacter sp.]|nr:hypothetical protein [Acetobacter sp.]